MSAGKTTHTEAKDSEGQQRYYCRIHTHHTHTQNIIQRGRKQQKTDGKTWNKADIKTAFCSPLPSSAGGIAGLYSTQEYFEFSGYFPNVFQSQMINMACGDYSHQGDVTEACEDEEYWR